MRADGEEWVTWLGGGLSDAVSSPAMSLDELRRVAQSTTQQIQRTWGNEKSQAMIQHLARMREASRSRFGKMLKPEFCLVNKGPEISLHIPYHAASARSRDAALDT